MYRKRITITSLFLAILSGFLGLFGVLGWCCTITGAAVLSFLGLAFMSSFLFYHEKWFLIAALIFTGLAIFSYFKYRQSKNCLNKK